MIKSILTTIICLGVLVSVQTVFAEEELPLPEGKNIKEWESISATLVAEKRFSEAIIYLDKILEQEPDNVKALTNKAGLLAQLGNYSKSLSLSNKVLEIDPDRVSALTNKAIVLQMMKEYKESFDTFSKILEIDPDNEKIKTARAKLLSGTPTISTNNSEYEVHVQVILRDKDENLIAVTESNNARILPSIFTESWWKLLDKKGHISHIQKSEIFTDTKPLIPSDDYLGMITLDKEMNGYDITIFEVFIPMIQIEETDHGVVQWTIIKK
ncbi:MAG: tetratricopeptide repeat protein [Thermoproteota archaeon]|nr:tetratricopeptide repeat protein [Thermoproteota archaeon]